jgi:hypothetical protein
MLQVIPEKYRDLFNKRSFASLGTLMPDGSPQVTPVWCDIEGDLVIVNTAKGRQKDKNMRRDPSRSQKPAPTPISTRWQRSTSGRTNTLTVSRAKCVSCTKFSPSVPR